MLTQPKSKSPIIESLQGLRAIAALSVVLFHLGGLLDKDIYHSNFFGFFSFGAAGVDLFFVLSGFIIYYTVTQKPNLRFKEYLYLRFIRIFPIYWIAILATLAMFLVFNFMHFGSDGYVATVVKEGGWYFLLKSALLIPTIKPLIAVSWTLSFEVAFYSLFCLYFWRPRILHVGLFFWLLFSFLWTYFFQRMFMSKARPLTHYSIPSWQNLFMAVSLQVYTNMSVRNFLCFLSFFLGLILFSVFIYNVTNPAAHRELYFDIPAAFIMYGVLTFKKCPSLLKKLGDASYSLYLFHFPILAVSIKLYLKFLPHLNLDSTLVGIALTLVVVSACWLIYQYVEKPLLNKFRHPKRSLSYAPAMQAI